MENFKPTYLYIKQHKVTGKLYFGKTIRDDVEFYKGSGEHWRSHYNYHGKNEIETLWYCEFHDQKSCTEFALMCSEMWDIVNSKEWLNKQAENGLDKRTGLKHSEETKRRMSESAKGRVVPEEQIQKRKETIAANGRYTPSDETKQKVSDSLKRAYADGRKTVSEKTKQAARICNIGRVMNEETKRKISAGNKGKVLSDETKAKMRKPKPTGTCTRCGVVAAVGMLTLYHNDKCKN